MKKKFLIVYLMFFTLMGCSRLDLALNLANSYLTNKADNLFDLTSEQKSWMKAAIERDMAKVKKSILPQLAAEMFKTADMVSGQRTFDATTTLTTYNRVENLFFQTLRIFTPDAVIFADKLTPAQVNYFQKRADEKISDLKDKPDKKFYTKIKKQFDSWFGTTTSTQKDMLEKFIDKNPSPVSEIIYSRQQLVHGFIKAYPDKIARAKYVEKLFNQYDTMLAPSFVKIIEERDRKVAGFITSVLNTMTEDQKKTLVDTLRDRANQLMKISRD